MKKIVLVVLSILVLLGTGVGLGKFVFKEKTKEVKSEVNKNKYVQFNLEVYDQIKTNYWEKINDSDLSNLYLLAVDRLTNSSNSLKSKDRSGVEKLLENKIKEIDENKRVEFSASLADLVLANLQPMGRSRLYAQKDAQSLTNTVNNINSGVNRFEQLGIDKSSDDKEVEEAFVKKEAEATSSAEKEELKQAYKTLKDEEGRKLYENTGVEATIDYKLIGNSVFYVHLTKFSPTSLEEFAKAAAKVDSGDVLETLVFDLRGNIGGSLDLLPYFMGPFVGPETNAFQLYHQGEKEDYTTRTGWLNSLVRYKKVVILIDENSQSTAETMAASMKKFNVGVVMGRTTKGWGTVEKVFPLEQQISDTEKYSLFLVHRITLRDDGQPIEGRGVEPLISIDDPNWKKEILKRFGDQRVVSAIEKIYSE